MGPQPADSSVLSGSRHHLWRAICLLLILMSAPIASGILYQSLSLARERRAYPPPGRMVDVDGRKMHLYCRGRGNPVVILDSGLGNSYMAWERIQPKIATFVQVCSYDRAGMGYSEPSSRPRTSSVFAEELHELPHHAGLQVPYLLVGHSMAGFNSPHFCSPIPVRSGWHGSGRCLSSEPTAALSAGPACHESGLDLERRTPRVRSADWHSSAARVLWQ